MFHRLRRRRLKMMHFLRAKDALQHLLYKNATNYFISCIIVQQTPKIMKGEHLGELEELVLLTIGSLYQEAYAVAILEEIKKNTNRKMDVTAIHSVLRRLEKKGYTKSEMGGATAERGGRRKRYFVLTQIGRKVLDDTMELRVSLYNKMPKLAFAGI